MVYHGIRGIPRFERDACILHGRLGSYMFTQVMERTAKWPLSNAVTMAQHRPWLHGQHPYHFARSHWSHRSRQSHRSHRSQLAWVAEAGIFEGSSRQKMPIKLLMLGWWWHRLRIFNSFLRTRIGGGEHQGNGLNVWGSWNHNAAMGNFRWRKAQRGMLYKRPPPAQILHLYCWKIDGLDGDTCWQGHFSAIFGGANGHPGTQNQQEWSSRRTISETDVKGLSRPNIWNMLTSFEHGTDESLEFITERDQNPRDTLPAGVPPDLFTLPAQVTSNSRYIVRVANIVSALVPLTAKLQCPCHPHISFSGRHVSGIKANLVDPSSATAGCSVA